MKIIILTKGNDKIFININYIESFYKHKGRLETTLQINRAGDYIVHYVKETPEEIMDKIRQAAALV